MLEVNDLGLSIVFKLRDGSISKVFPHLLCDLKLDCVVPWGDSHDIPLKLSEGTMALEVVEDGQVDQDEKDTQAGDH